MGAKFAPALNGVDPKQRLVVICDAILGQYAIPIVAATIALSCLTTLCIVTNLFAKFLRKQILREIITKDQSIVITLILTFAISSIGFTQLASLISKALHLFYPAFIVFALIKIFQNL